MEDIHIVFCHSAAATLREALIGIGIRDRVYNCWGDYQAGPLSVPLSTRLEWLCDYFYGVGTDEGGIELRSDYIERYNEFRELTANDSARKTIWFSKANAKEYCGYCEFLFHSEPGSDLTQAVELSSALPEKHARFPLSSGSARPEEFIKALPECRKIMPTEILEEMVRWKQLRQENTALRNLSSNGLQSVEIGFFDSAILSFVTESFQSAARIVGNTLGCVDLGKTFSQGNSDLFYFSRLRELHKQGALDWDGSFHLMREARVRLVS